MSRRYAVILETGLPNPFAARQKGPFLTKKRAIRYAKKARAGRRAVVVKSVWSSR